MTTKIVNTPGTTPTQHIADVIEIMRRVVDGWGYEFEIIYGSTTWPDHSNRRCADFMTSSARLKLPRGASRPLSVAEQIAFGDRLADYFTSHAKPLGLNGLIWNRRVKGFPHVEQPAYRGPYGEWRPYTGESPHVDHNHVEVDGDGVDKTFLKTAGTNIAAQAGKTDTTTTNQEDDMPTPKDLFESDIIDAPPSKKTKDNPTWRLSAFLRNTYELVLETARNVREIKALLEQQRK